VTAGDTALMFAPLAGLPLALLLAWALDRRANR
jgi:hypothetical protein